MLVLTWLSAVVAVALWVCSVAGIVCAACMIIIGGWTAFSCPFMFPCNGKVKHNNFVWRANNAHNGARSFHVRDSGC